MITREQIDNLKSQRSEAARQLSRCEREGDADTAKYFNADMVALDAAIATLERLPVTADGVRVAPGDEVWVMRKGGAVRAIVEPFHEWDDPGPCHDVDGYTGVYAVDGRGLKSDICYCHSTSQSAEAAAQPDNREGVGE